jgi:predicted aldo/keto reductase-like oxidoreductase
MDSELQEVFNYAISKGVTLLDTADSYGQCTSLQEQQALNRVTDTVGPTLVVCLCRMTDVAGVGRDWQAERTERATAGEVHS